jgi:spore germination protein GerM
MRKRSLYMVDIDASGNINLEKSVRDVPASDSPMLDALKLLLAGPDPAEKKQGFRSLIPPGTRILGASVKNGVATVNLSDDFLFNSNGAEAYYAALKQLVWTCTEFSNVRQVQILINGQKQQFLAENIPIGNPVGRDSLQ